MSRSIGGRLVGLYVAHVSQVDNVGEVLFGDLDSPYGSISEA